MPRKGPAPKRPLVSDPVYGSPLVTQLVNKVLKDGKRSLAERIVYAALEGTRDKTGTDPVVTLKRALDNVKPALEVRSRRVGGVHSRQVTECGIPVGHMDVIFKLGAAHTRRQVAATREGHHPRTAFPI